MTDADLEAEFILGWVSQAVPGLAQDPEQSSTDQEPLDVLSTSKKRPSRLVGESGEKREQRLRLARECSARRRSLETTEQRERRLKDQRERMAQKRCTESGEEREIRLKKAREREYERRCTETPEKREKRLKYSKEKAALRRESETSEQRERRLDISRQRATQRRQSKKGTSGSSSPFPEPDSTPSPASTTSDHSSAPSLVPTSHHHPTASSPAPSRPVALNNPEAKMATRPVIQNLATTCTYSGSAELVQGNMAVARHCTSNYFDDLCVSGPPANSSARVNSSNSYGTIESTRTFEPYRSGFTSDLCVTSEPCASGVTSEPCGSGITSGPCGSGMTSGPCGSGMISELHGGSMTSEPCGSGLTSGHHWSGVPSEPHGHIRHCLDPLQESRDNPGGSGGGILGGMGFLERRQHDHPDFKYQDMSQGARFGIHPVILLGGGNSVQ